MDSRLLKKSDNKEELEVELRNSRILERVRDVIEARVKIKDKTSEEDYKIANWAYLRADSDGYIRAMTDVLNLIKKP